MLELLAGFRSCARVVGLKCFGAHRLGGYESAASARRTTPSRELLQHSRAPRNRFVFLLHFGSGLTYTLPFS